MIAQSVGDRFFTTIFRFSALLGSVVVITAAVMIYLRFKD